MITFTQQVNNAQTADQAYRVFQTATQSNTSRLGGAFFHSVLTKLAQDNGNNVDRSLTVYTEMKKRNISLRVNNYNKLMQICTKVGNLALGLNILKEMNENKVDPNNETINHLTSCCVHFNQSQAAYNLLGLLQNEGMADIHTQINYNLLLRKNLKDKNLEQARKVYDLKNKGILKPDLISSNQLIDAYANQGNTLSAGSIYQDMKGSGIRPDRITFNSLIKAGVIARNRTHVSQMYQEMKSHGMEADTNMHKHCWKIVKNEWMKPTDENTKTSCQRFYATCSRINDFSKFAFSNPQGFNKVQASRVEGSNTIAKDFKARQLWNETDNAIRDVAAKKLPISAEFIKGINKKLGGSGIFREKGQEVVAGSSREFLYAPGEFVKEEMDQFMTWLTKSVDLCDRGQANPIETAARAYQRLVSIHPFPNENGRTSRLVMDYILQRYQLPPAALGKNIKVAIFSFASTGENPSTAADNILQGVKQSYGLLQAK